MMMKRNWWSGHSFLGRFVDSSFEIVEWRNCGTSQLPPLNLPTTCLRQHHSQIFQSGKHFHRVLLGTILHYHPNHLLQAAFVFVSLPENLKLSGYFFGTIPTLTWIIGNRFRTDLFMRCLQDQQLLAYLPLCRIMMRISTSSQWQTQKKFLSFGWPALH